jgi:hypothetical protein
MELLTHFLKMHLNGDKEEERKKRGACKSLFFPKQEIHTLMEVGVWHKKINEKPKHV